MYFLAGYFQYPLREGSAITVMPSKGKRCLGFCDIPLSARQFAHIDILEMERVAVMLEFDGSRRVDRLVALPIVFERDIVDDAHAIQEYRDFFADHDNVETVPLSGRKVGAACGFVGIFLVVVESAGTFGIRAFRFVVPDIDLRAATQIDSAVAMRLDFPVYVEFEIAVIFEIGRASCRERV